MNLRSAEEECNKSVRIKDKKKKRSKTGYIKMVLEVETEMIYSNSSLGFIWKIYILFNAIKQKYNDTVHWPT